MVDNPCSSDWRIPSPCWLTGTAGVGLLLTAMGIGSLAGCRGDDADGTSKPAGQSRQFTQPNPALTPDAVVRLQLAALNANGVGDRGIQQCFRFASPLNREATGPLPRFRELLHTQQYEVMLRQRSTLIGRPVVKENKAVVLVTIIGSQRQAHVFRFYLSKQTDPPYAGCWMTDAVLEVGSSKSVPQPPREPTPPPVEA